MKKIKSSNLKYPQALKRQIAREYLRGKFSYAVGAQEYGLKDKAVVKEFVRWYKKSADIVDMETSTGVNESPEVEGTSDQLKALEQELAAAKLRIAGLETLIDVAEEELSIQIRKKSGTKQ